MKRAVCDRGVALFTSLNHRVIGIEHQHPENTLRDPIDSWLQIDVRTLKNRILDG